MSRILYFVPLIFVILTSTGAAADPIVGDHSVNFYFLSGNNSIQLSTPPMLTSETGSTILVGVGRGELDDFSLGEPFDNMGNGAYQQIGSAHAYTNWANSGTAMYVCPSAVGGNEHVISVPTSAYAEISMVAVEIAGGDQVQDCKWSEVLAGNPITSETVTTTGPATLVAFWWGDGPGGPFTATPNNGFVVIESILIGGWIVQCAVATLEVPSAGTYDVTWTSTPEQGAQLWIAAIQNETTSAAPPMPKGFTLNQNYPNPFNPSTNIRFSLPEPLEVKLNIYSVEGSLVRSLVSEQKPAGSHGVVWNGKDDRNQTVPSGIYFYRLQTKNFTTIKKMVLTK